MKHVYEHPTGVILHITYDAGAKPIIKEVRIADTSYKPIGPDLLDFLHNIHTIDTTGPVTMATPMLELIALDLP